MGCSDRHYIPCREKRKKNSTAVNVHRLCPLVLRLKLVWRQSSVLEIIEGKVMGNGLLGCAAWEISRIFGMNFEFRPALLQIFGSKLEMGELYCG